MDAGQQIIVNGQLGTVIATAGTNGLVSIQGQPPVIVNEWNK